MHDRLIKGATLAPPAAVGLRTGAQGKVARGGAVERVASPVHHRQGAAAR
ncbi:MAG TPA: hypothetical protein PK359_19150 [Burkholderiaceae bacterium]|nr:hypothetical protein [Burkholderiaceae bacterium]